MLPHRLVRDAAGRLPGENPGLVIERLAPPLTGQTEYGRFVAALAGTGLPRAYEAAFRRWQRRTPPSVGRRVLRLQTDAPLAIGLGEDVPGENGLTTLSPYGVPVIPGSAVKGVVRAYAESRLPDGDPWGAAGEDLGTLLGVGGDRGQADAAEGEVPPTLGQAGAVDFLDAWIEPAAGSPFVDDVITAHHAEYYQKQGSKPPAGFEGPNPVHFAAVDGRFRLVLEGPEAWLAPAVELVIAALSELGIGAKTRAGYGRLSVVDLDPTDQQQRNTEAARRRRERWLGLPAADRLREVEAHHAGRAAEFELALDAVVFAELDRIGILELRSPPEGLFDRDDADVRRAFAERLRQTAERRARKDGDRAQRFVATVRAWLPNPADALSAESVVGAEAASLGELVRALMEVAGFGAALEAWGRRQPAGGVFSRLDEPGFRATNTTKREVALALGRDRIVAVLPERAALRAELLKLSAK